MDELKAAFAKAARILQTSANSGRAARCDGADCPRTVGAFVQPFEEIARAITLTEQRQSGLDKLEQASAKAAEELQTSFPKEVTRTIEGRLHHAHRRIASLIQAIEIISPAMGPFYASLSDQQKAALSAQARANRSARR